MTSNCTMHVLDAPTKFRLDLNLETGHVLFNDADVRVGRRTTLNSVTNAPGTKNLIHVYVLIIGRHNTNMLSKKQCIHEVKQTMKIEIKTNIFTFSTFTTARIASHKHCFSWLGLWTQ